MADTQDLAKKLTFVDATHDLTRDVTEYENYFFGGGASSGEDSKDALIKKAKKDPNAQSLRRYKQTSLKFFWIISNSPGGPLFFKCARVWAKDAICLLLSLFLSLWVLSSFVSRARARFLASLTHAPLPLSLFFSQ